MLGGLEHASKVDPSLASLDFMPKRLKKIRFSVDDTSVAAK
jgi:hypothetical protein